MNQENESKSLINKAQCVKIKSGGFFFFVLVAAIIFFLWMDIFIISRFISLWRVGGLRQLIIDSIASEGLFRVTFAVLGFLLAALAPVILFMYSKASIEVTETDVTVKTIRNYLGGLQPKFQKNIMPIKELKLVFQKTDWVDLQTPSKLYWVMKDDKIVWTNAIYFSTKDLLKVFDKLKRRGIDTQMP